MLLTLVGLDEFAKDCRVAEFWEKSLAGGSQRKVFFPEGSLTADIAQALTPSFFEPAASVLVRHCELMAAEEQRRLADYINGQSGSFQGNLALDFYEIDKRSVLWKALEKQGSVEIFVPPSKYGNSLQKWVIDHVQKYFQRKISSDAAQYIADAIGADTKRINGEIKKIILYDSSIKEISMQHCCLFIQADRDVPAYELCESFGFRNLKVFLPKLRRILAEAAKDPSIAIIEALRGQCLSLLHVQSMRANRVPEHEIASKVLPPNMAWLYKKNLLPQCSYWQLASLQKTILSLDELAYGKKMGFYKDLPSFELAICNLML
jgi:DNA polymerase-3 subunit delta